MLAVDASWEGSPVARCLQAQILVLALALSACRQDAAAPDAADAIRAPAGSDGVEAEIFPHASAQLPEEALDPDGRIAPWAMGAQVGATLQALAEACGEQTAAQSRPVAAEHRRMLALQGADAARLDVVWTWAYRQGRQKIAMQPTAELEHGCRQLREMQQDAGRMQELMREMSLPGG